MEQTNTCSLVVAQPSSHHAEPETMTSISMSRSPDSQHSPNSSYFRAEDSNCSSRSSARTRRRGTAWQQQEQQQQQQQQQDRREIVIHAHAPLAETLEFGHLLAPILIPGACAQDVTSSSNSLHAAMSSSNSGGNLSVSNLKQEVMNVSSASAQLLGADFLALSIRTGLPINVVKLLLLRMSRMMKKGRMSATNSSPYAASLGLATNSFSTTAGTSSTPAIVATSRSSVSSRSTRRRRRSVANMTATHVTCREPRGLKNHGQTCFLNSVLQALSASRPFLLYLEGIVDHAIRMDELKHRLGVGTNDGRGSTAYATAGTSSSMEKEEMLSEVILDILLFINGLTADDDNNSNDMYRKRSLDVRQVLRRVGQEHAQFRARAGGMSHVGTEQQDAQELLQALIGMVEAEGSASTSTGGSKGAGCRSVMAEECDDMDDASISVVSACQSDDQLLTCDEYNTYDVITANNGFNVTSDPKGVLTLSEILVQMGTLQDRMEKASTMSDGRTESLSVSRREEKKDDDADNPSRLVKEQLEAPIGSSTLKSAAPPVVMFGPPPGPSPLTGWIGSTLQCCACKHVRPITNVPFLEIPIIPTSIGTAGGDGFVPRGSPSSPLPACSIYECLKDFTSVERVHGVECQSCSIKAELERIDDEMALLQGAVESVVSRSSKSRGGGSDDVGGLQREIQALEARRFRLESADVDEIYDDIASDVDGDDYNIDKEGDKLPPPIRGDASKCLVLSRAPPMLCFHIQRRYYDASSDRMVKAMQIVLFREVIDLAPFCAYTSNHNTMEYRLMSVIEHRGNAHAGHYVTYRRVASTDGKDWALVSDETVSYCTWDDVRRSQAYMLIYEAM